MKTNKVWEMTGYTPITDYWEIFSEITNVDDLERAFEKHWEIAKQAGPYILAEFVMVLNHCCWDAYDAGWFPLSQELAAFYEKAHDYALICLNGEDLTTYLQIVD